MDMRNGRIFSAEELAKFKECMTSKEWEKEKSHYLEMEKPPTPRQLSRQPPKVGRNEPCPCGSGEKFKRCHLQVLGYRPVEAE